MPNKDDLQTLIDLPNGRLMFFARDDGTETRPFLATDKLIALATELRDRRAFMETANHVEFCSENGMVGIYREINHVTLSIDGQEVGDFSSAFEAWQNAKREGRL